MTLEAILASSLVAAAAWGHLETWRLRAVRTRFSFPLVPRTFEGYRIALVGGLHLRRMGGWTRRVQRVIADLRPDIVLLGGDVKPTHGSDNQRIHDLLAEFLAPIHPPDGFLAVRGYHDRHGFWDALPSDSRIRLLSNSSHAVTRGGSDLFFLGVQTAHACHLDRGINQLRETVAGLPPEGFRILVGQSGDLLRVAQGQPVHLILAVDNLHAQIRIPGVGVIRRDSKAPLSWERGWIREGTLSMYLSPGLGTRWLPFRFFLRPEVVCVELSSSPSS